MRGVVVRFWNIAALLTLTVMCITILSSGTAEAQDPSLDYKPVQLEELVASPTKYKNMAVTFRAIFHQSEDTYTPFFTPFLPENHFAFSVWAPNTALWTRDGHLSDVPTVFIPKTSKYADRLMKLDTYAWVEIYGVVSSDFNGYPWISVTGVRRETGDTYSAKNLHHLIAGLTAWRKHQPNDAITNLEAAIEAGLPEVALGLANEVLGNAYLQLGSYDSALRAYEASLRVDSDNGTVREKARFASHAVSDTRSGGDGPETPAWAYAPDVMEVEEGESMEDELAGLDREAAIAMVRDLKARLNSVTTALEAAEQQNATLQTERDGAVAQISKGGEDVAALKSQAAAAAKTLKTEAIARQQVEEDAKNVTRLRARITQLENEQAELGAQHAAMQELYATTKGELDAAGGLIEERDMLNTQVAELDQALATAVSERDALAAQVEQLQGDGVDVAALNQEIADLNAQVQTLQAERDALAQQIEDLQTGEVDIAGLNQKLADLETSLDNATMMVEAKDQQIADLEQQLAASGTNEEVDALKAQVAELETQRGDLETERNQLTLELTDAQSRIDELNAALEGAGTGEDSAAAEALQAELAEANEQLAAKAGELDSATAEIGNLKTAVDNLKAEIRRLAEEE